MCAPLSRRDFLKLSGLSLGATAYSRLSLSDLDLYNHQDAAWMPWPPGESGAPRFRGRVTTDFINIYNNPHFKSERIGRVKRDTILWLYEELVTNYPHYNPRWYHLERGYVHSGYIQRVEKIKLNKPLLGIPASGRLGEITVPFSQCLRKTRTYGWIPLYRLYFGSVHWITGLERGPDGRTWYELTDELLNVRYCIPAEHMRAIPPAELEPISPDVPAEDKRIEISLREQILTAYEGDEVAQVAKVSTGLPNHLAGGDSDIPTDTPEGQFRVQVKVPSKHMGDGDLTDDINAYELPGVPWVCFFHASGVAFHGTYWHDNFGRKMSHGCVNMRNDDAKWLYRWTEPVAGPREKRRLGLGTLIKIS